MRKLQSLQTKHRRRKQAVEKQRHGAVVGKPSTGRHVGLLCLETAEKKLCLYCRREEPEETWELYKRGWEGYAVMGRKENKQKRVKE